MSTPRWLSDAEMPLIVNDGAWQAIVLEMQSGLGLPALIAILKGAPGDPDGHALGCRFRGGSGKQVLDVVWPWRRDGSEIVLSRPNRDDVRLPLPPQA